MVTSVLQLVVMTLAGWVASLLASIRRLIHGPTLPSWGWATEWTVAFMRAVLTIGARRPDNPVVFRLGLVARSPILPPMRGRVSVRSVRFGGLRADRYAQSGHPRPERVLLYFHGGGYVLGNPGTHRDFIARLVDTTGWGAVAPQYRLAPRHRYPAAVDDAEQAYRTLLAGGVDPAKVVLAGDSAGGGLSMALLVRLRTLGLPMPGGAILFSPYLDLEHTTYTIRTNASTDYLPLSEMTKPNDSYADPDQLRLPEVSPIHADLSGFPPILVFAGGAEMILGDSLRLAEHAERDGVPLDLVIEPEMMHVWPILSPREAATERLFEEVGRWSEHLAAT